MHVVGDVERQWHPGEVYMEAPDRVGPGIVEDKTEISIPNPARLRLLGETELRLIEGAIVWLRVE